MPTHVYQRGETIISIARKYKFRAWRPVWEHGNNAGLRAQRPNPNQLAQGDKVFVPDKQPREQGCITNKRHIFWLRGMTQHVQQRLLNEDGDPMPGLAYTLVCAGDTFPGTTDADGELLEEVSLDAKTATLTVTMPDGEKVEWSLQLGHLEPASTVYGLKARLSHLGYDCGPVNDSFDDKARSALEAFQADNDLPATGERDAATIEQLETAHDRDPKG